MASSVFLYPGNLTIGGNLLLPASAYINFGTTTGSSGYGFRDNSGTMEFKNSGGSWTSFGSVPGSDTQVIFNDGGAFGADAGMTYNKTLDNMSLAGNLGVNGGDATADNLVIRSEGDGFGFALRPSDGSPGAIVGFRQINGGTQGGRIFARAVYNGSFTVDLNGLTGAGVFSGGVQAASYSLNTVLAMSSTAPTIASGFGTNPSIVASNGSVAFTVNVGTGGTASAGVITMPAATTGWICHVENRTAVAANRADQRTVQTGSSTTSITVQNQTISTGAALAWTASDVLVILAIAY